MNYFVPNIALASMLEPQLALEEKLGGLPWGLPAARWPLCGDCGAPQSLLAQFHHSERLDLGRAGRVMFVFQCNADPGVCETWAGDSGANACFIIEPETLTSSLTSPPSPARVEVEARVIDWFHKDDDLPPEVVSSFFSDEKFLALEDSVFASVKTGTRLGSVPFWIQGPDEGPGVGWRFVGQLDSLYSFFGPLPSPDQAGCKVGRETAGSCTYDEPAVVKDSAPRYLTADSECWEGRTWTSEGPNFGGGGIGYIFLRETTGTPEGCFFWQCG